MLSTPEINTDLWPSIVAISSAFCILQELMSMSSLALPREVRITTVFRVVALRLALCGKAQSCFSSSRSW